MARLEFQGVDVELERWDRLAQAALDDLGTAGRNSPQAALADDLSQAAMAFYADRFADLIPR